MHTNKKFPYTMTRSEVSRIVHACRNIHLRVGQAVVNTYFVSKDLEDSIYEDNDFHSVVSKIYDHYHRPEYQNVLG